MQLQETGGPATRMSALASFVLFKPKVQMRVAIFLFGSHGCRKKLPMIHAFVRFALR